jgi:hypothetical protein
MVGHRAGEAAEKVPVPFTSSLPESSLMKKGTGTTSDSVCTEAKIPHVVEPVPFFIKPPGSDELTGYADRTKRVDGIVGIDWRKW